MPISAMRTRWSPRPTGLTLSYISRRNRRWIAAFSRLSPVIHTNFRASFTLLDAARRLGTGLFAHISTDEVYGSLEAPAEATEEFPLNASSHYSASKAGSDLLARSYFVTYELPVMITRASNNYWPYQFP
jgi:dTDP-glucose 4,6-dehydratase